MLVLSGGVSAGKYDFVEDVLLSLGAEFFFTGVAMQPGKPAVFGRIPPTTEHPEQWIFGLPGNPVSTQVTALLFAVPMVRALAGEVEAQANFAQAKLTVGVKVRPGLTRFLPARMESSLAGATVKPTGWQGSGDLNANARANCYLVVPPDAAALQPNDVVTVLLRSR
jgi:molybdopterin molybdotransferase